ncbi:MAG: MBL fold metallo-hydrolase [Gammaproteobacteria bacterium]|nr:MBL fold metallo-hydrolase [Gammaproteobacteria bacterium]
MKSYQPLGHGVYHLDSHYIKPGVASFYCIVHQDEVAVIETGTSHSLPYLQQFLIDLKLSPEQVKYIIPTHVHLDHAGGAGVMMQACPNAQLIIHPRGARHMIDPTKLISATKDVYGEQLFNKLYGEIPAIDETRVIAAQHESSFYLNDRELIIVDTPGHAYHHFCVVDSFSQGIFTGDTFGLSYPNLIFQGKRVVLPTTTPVHFNPEALFNSIDLLMSFQPERMYLTHFNMLPDPSSVVDQFRKSIDDFVQLTELIKPVDDSCLPDLMKEMGKMISRQFEFSQDLIINQLAMDIKLNSQGLAFWYQHR